MACVTNVRQTVKLNPNRIRYPRFGQHFEEIAKNGQKNSEETTIPAIFALSESIFMEPERTLASMDEFCRQFSSHITNERYLIYTKDYAHKEAVRNIPVYMTYFL